MFNLLFPPVCDECAYKAKQISPMSELYCMIDNKSDRLNYIEMKCVLLSVFPENSITSLSDNCDSAFTLSLNSSMANSQIATIITNYNLGVTVGIIIDDNAAVMAKGHDSGKRSQQWQISLNKATGTMWLHFQ